MRTALGTAICLALVVGAVPASFAHDSQVLDQCKSAGTEIETEERLMDQRAGSNMGVVVSVPIGRVCVGPESLDGEPSYVRRTTGREGMAIVEVSTTPFMPDLRSGEVPAGVIVRPDQPAGW